jgi:hypothetical protein
MTVQRPGRRSSPAHAPVVSFMAFPAAFVQFDSYANASRKSYTAGPIRSHLLPAMSANTATRP